jgi:hypothetical protein
MKYGWGRLKREERLVLALLNEDYEKAEVLLKNRETLSFLEFFNLADLHRILPLLLIRLIDNFPHFLSEETLKVARLLILQQKTANKLHRRELFTTAGLLKEKGFDITLMKGLSYDPDETYPRTYGDLDLLVEEEKIEEVISFLKEKGYTYTGSFILSHEEINNIKGQLSWNNQYPFNCPSSPQSVEIHTNLFERDRIRLEDLTTLLNKPELFKKNREWNKDLNCNLPSREASLMLLCLHCSLKRALYNNSFLLRHMSDLKILLNRGIDGEAFLALCTEAKVCYHALFTLKLYGIIGKKHLPSWCGELEKALNHREMFLLNRHLKCMKNLDKSRFSARLIYNFTAPFIIGGNYKQKLTWLRNNIFPTKVEQEYRYFRFGFRKESPLIYLTYFIDPFYILWNFIKRIFHIKDSSSPEL